MNFKLTNVSIDRPLAVLDLESTGLDVARDRIVEAAVLKLNPGARPASYQRLVHPGVPIPTAATLVHGIADADVAGAPAFAAVAGDLLRFLGGCDLAGFGIAAFDLPLLAAECARAGRRFQVAGR